MHGLDGACRHFLGFRLSDYGQLHTTLAPIYRGDLEIGPRHPHNLGNSLRHCLRHCLSIITPGCSTHALALVGVTTMHLRWRQHRRSTLHHPHALLNVVRVFDSLIMVKMPVLSTCMHLTPFGLSLKRGDRDETVTPRPIPRSVLHGRVIT